jgi:hypothetical protein
MKILLEDCSLAVGREYTFKLIIGDESLRKISNDSGINVANFAISKNQISRVQCYHIIKLINSLAHLLKERYDTQSDYVLIDRRRYSSILDVPYFWRADFNTDYKLMVVKV